MSTSPERNSRRRSSTVTDGDWAVRFRAATARLSRHVCWRGFWPDHRRISEMVDGMFTAFQGAPEPPSLRVFVDAGLRYDLLENLVARGGRGRLPLEQWLGRRIGHDRFCVTLNGLTQWSEPFHLEMQRKLLAPLFEACGPPSLGTEFYAFVGNYGYTPFGIHEDPDHSLLIHLGPEPKMAWIWPDATYVKHRGSRAPSRSTGRLRRVARRYLLRSGDLLYIPSGTFHVLESPRFAVTLGLTIFPATPQATLTECAPLVDDLRPASIVRAQHRHKAIVASNGYVVTRPEVARRVSLKGRFQVPIEFPVHYEARRHVGEIFARGRSITLRHSAAVRRLVRWLNRCTPFEYRDFVNVLGGDVELKAARLLFMKLHQIRAFWSIASSPRINSN
jgi:hypothetical protein